MRRGFAKDNSEKRQLINTEAASCVSCVDVCNSPAAATSVFVLPLPVWQLTDDNRWRALITSSQCNVKSYPAFSQGRDEEYGEAATKTLHCCVGSRAPALVRLMHTPEHGSGGRESRAARYLYGSGGGSADAAIIYDWVRVSKISKETCCKQQANNQTS